MTVVIIIYVIMSQFSGRDNYNFFYASPSTILVAVNIPIDCLIYVAICPCRPYRL